MPTTDIEMDLILANAEIKRLKALVPEWISVKEQLPSRDEKCLCCYCFRGHYDMPFMSVLDYYATDEIPHFQHTLGNENMEVTHWMPIPQPPNEGEDHG